MAARRLFKFCWTPCANIQTQDGWGLTPLHTACENGHPHTAKLLLVAGGKELEAREKGDNRTALMSTCYTGYPQVVQVLLEAGADQEAKDKHGKTTLDIAQEGKHIDCVKVLQSHCIKPKNSHSLGKRGKKQKNTGSSSSSRRKRRKKV